MDGVARNYLEAISAGFSYRDPPPPPPPLARPARPAALLALRRTLASVVWRRHEKRRWLTFKHCATVVVLGQRRVQP